MLQKYHYLLCVKRDIDVFYKTVSDCQEEAEHASPWDQSQYTEHIKARMDINAARNTILTEIAREGAHLRRWGLTNKLQYGEVNPLTWPEVWASRPGIIPRIFVRRR